MMLWRKSIPDGEKAQKPDLEVRASSADSRNDQNAR